MKIVSKVGALVIRRPSANERAQLLLFTHTDFPDATIQFPGGGLEPDEDPLEGARRELREEAGLADLPLLRSLGTSEHPSILRPDEFIRRHCFLFDGTGLPDAWEHVVTGAGEDHALRFSYRWHDTAPGFTLVGDLGHFITPEHLPELFSRSPHRPDLESAVDNAPRHAARSRNHLPGAKPSRAIRLADPADAGEIARINVEAWRAAYRGIVPDAYLDGLSIPPRAERWENTLRETRAHVLVACLDDRISGYVAFGTSRDPGEEENAEIQAIYIDPLRQRLGLGRVLLAEAERQVAILQPKAALVAIWVLEQNHDTRAFYTAQGYAPDGAAKITPIGDAPLPLVRYTKRLSRA